MLKKIIATTLVATALMFSGCGESDSAGEDQLSTQNAIDLGDYSLAIATMEAKPASERTDAENLLLASAYMGRAGFSLTDIIVTIQDASTSTATTSDLENFKDSVIGDGITAAQLADIESAILAYEAIDGAITLAPSLVGAADVGISDTQLKLGLAYIIKFMIMLENGATNAELAIIANDAFDYVLAVAPTDVLEQVQAVKDDVDTDFDGTITTTEIAALLALLP